MGTSTNFSNIAPLSTILKGILKVSQPHDQSDVMLIKMIFFPYFRMKHHYYTLCYGCLIVQQAKTKEDNNVVCALVVASPCHCPHSFHSPFNHALQFTHDFSYVLNDLGYHSGYMTWRGEGVDMLQKY